MLKVKTAMLAVLLSLLLATWVNAQESKERVYVWDFVDNTRRPDITARITSEFEEELIRAKCYQVLERRRFDEVLKHIKNEKAIADLNDLSKSSQNKIKEITNAQIVVFGKVDDDIDSGEIKISVTFQHFDSSKEVESIRMLRGKFSDAESRENAMKELVKKICDSNALPQDSQTYFERGFLKYLKGDYKGAFQDFKKVVNSDPTNPEAYNYCGSCLYHLGQCKEAIEYFDRAINLNKNFSQAYSNRGDCKYAVGDKQGAINDHRVAAKAGLVLSQNWLKLNGLSIDDSMPEEQQNSPEPIYTFNISGWIKSKEGAVTEINVRDYSNYVEDQKAHMYYQRFAGTYWDFELRVEEYKDGKLCGVGEMKPGHQNFPGEAVNNDAVESSGSFFRGGCSIVPYENGMIHVFLIPGKECKKLR